MNERVHRDEVRTDGYLQRLERTILAARVFALGSLGVLILGFCLGEFSGIGDLQQRAEKYGDWDGIAAMLFLMMKEGSLATWSWTWWCSRSSGSGSSARQRRSPRRSSLGSYSGSPSDGDRPKRGSPVATLTDSMNEGDTAPAGPAGVRERYSLTGAVAPTVPSRPGWCVGHPAVGGSRPMFRPRKRVDEALGDGTSGRGRRSGAGDVGLGSGSHDRVRWSSREAAGPADAAEAGCGCPEANDMSGGMEPRHLARRARGRQSDIRAARRLPEPPTRPLGRRGIRQNLVATAQGLRPLGQEPRQRANRSLSGTRTGGDLLAADPGSSSLIRKNAALDIWGGGGGGRVDTPTDAGETHHNRRRRHRRPPSSVLHRSPGRSGSDRIPDCVGSRRTSARAGSVLLGLGTSHRSCAWCPSRVGPAPRDAVLHLCRLLPLHPQEGKHALPGLSKSARSERSPRPRLSISQRVVRRSPCFDGSPPSHFRSRRPGRASGDSTAVRQRRLPGPHGVRFREKIQEQGSPRQH